MSTKYELKMLRDIYRHSSRPLLYLNERYDRETVVTLFDCGMICTGNINYLDGIPDDALISLTKAGIEDVEQHQWFDAEYVLSHILVPIVVSVIATLITLCATALLFPSL